MLDIPSYINFTFALITLLTVALFYRASHHSKTTLIILFLWLIFQSVLGIAGFYRETADFPPRFLMMVFPPLLFIICLFIFPAGRKFLDNLDVPTLTMLHVNRVIVEMVLLWLFMNKAVPELMTFRGRNFDILAGITAPLIYYFGFVKRKISVNGILIWNIISLALVINIIVNGVLSAPFSFQKFAFDQPNIAVLYFPFNWLPSVVVPLVILSHFAALRQLGRKQKSPLQTG